MQITKKQQWHPKQKSQIESNQSRPTPHPNSTTPSIKWTEIAAGQPQSSPPASAPPSPYPLLAPATTAAMRKPRGAMRTARRRGEQLAVTVFMPDFRWRCLADLLGARHHLPPSCHAYDNLQSLANQMFPTTLSPDIAPRGRESKATRDALKKRSLATTNSRHNDEPQSLS